MKLTDHNTPEALAAAKVKCKPGSSKIECGVDADESRIIVDVQRNKGRSRPRQTASKSTRRQLPGRGRLNQYEAAQSRLSS